jgi:prepilin-type processing-associated H-X9-DG protein
MQCGNNVKQLCLGLQNYHDTFLYLPYGARVRTAASGGPYWGSSWLVATLPFCEQRPLFDKLVATDIAAAGNHYNSSAVVAHANNAKIKYMLCPSSPLPEMETVSSASLNIPSYTGIAGGTSFAGGSPVVAANVVTETRVNTTSAPASSATTTGFGGNGMLPLNDSLTFAACTDGTANTIIVGECSDWYYQWASGATSPTRQNPSLGKTIGWLAGANITNQATAGGASFAASSVANLQTVAHPVGINNRTTNNAAYAWDSNGIGLRGPNNPLLSAHPAGAMLGFLDGHVILITKQTAVHITKRLAIRDDGGVIPDF